MKNVESRYPGYTTLKVARSREVEHMTMNGWQMLDVVTETSTQGFVGNEPAHYSNSAVYDEKRTVETMRGHIVQETLFVMGKDDESVMASLRDELAERGKDIEAAEKCMNESGAERDLARDREWQARETRDFYKKELDKAEKVHAEDVVHRVQIEDDLVRVRNAIGDTRYDKIRQGEDVD